jgi:hypothetical protein
MMIFFLMPLLCFAPFSKRYYMPHPSIRQKEEQKEFLTVPIDLGPETEPVYLILYGTGIRVLPSPDAATIQIGDLDAPAGRINVFAFDFSYFAAAGSFGLALMYFFMSARISSSFSGMETLASWLRR